MDNEENKEVAEEATDNNAAAANSSAPAEGTSSVDGLDALRERLDSLAASSKQILDSLEAVRSSMAAFVEGGATIHEEKEDAAEDEAEDAEEAEIETPLEELDFDLDD